MAGRALVTEGRDDLGVSDLWECPDCRRRFVHVRQWHSCGNPDLDDVLEEASDEARLIYEAIVDAIGRAGEFRIHPQKTRISFITRMTFASVKLARRWVDLSFIVERAVDDARIRRIEVYGPTSFNHEIRVGSPTDVDRGLSGWLAAARRRGDQETLDPRARVEPLVGRPLEVVLVPLRTKVVDHGDRLGLSLPRHAVEVFEAHPRVIARMGRDRYPGTIEPMGDRSVLRLPRESLPVSPPYRTAQNLFPD